MYQRLYLQIPGPTNIPEPILNAMHRPAIDHRGKEFTALLGRCVEGLKEIFRTSGDILLFPGSGTGGLEAALANTLSPGDRVLALDAGVFSRRFGEIAGNFGAEVITVRAEAGDAVSPEAIEAVLAADKNFDIRAVLLTHNETATGVTMDLSGVRAAMDRLGHPALMLVDAVSSLAITPLDMDEIRADVVISASQKGLMLHSGLMIAAVGKRAWEASASAKMPRWFWDFSRVKQSMSAGQMPYTPPVALFFGLEASIGMLREEGLQNVLDRHAQNAEAVRAGLEALGLELLVREKAVRSNAVTAVRLPEGLRFSDLHAAAGAKGLVIGGGLQDLKDSIFRIGHLGMLRQPEVFALLGLLEAALADSGCNAKIGAAMSAAASIYRQSGRS